MQKKRRKDPAFVIELLREGKIKPEKVPDELLSLMDSNGVSVLDVCMDQFKRSSFRVIMMLIEQKKPYVFSHFSITPEILKISDPKSQWYIAHEFARQRWLPVKAMTPEILKLTDKDKVSVAHIIAANFRDYFLNGDVKNNVCPDEIFTPEIVNLVDNDGVRVLHRLAHCGYIPAASKTKEAMMQTTKGQGWTTYHFLALSGMFPPEFLTEEILCLSDKDNYSVAHVLASRNCLPAEKITHKILSLETNCDFDFINGRSVAAILIEKGFFPQELIPKFLLERYKIAEGVYLPLIHMLLCKGVCPSLSLLTPEVLKTKDAKNHTVMDILIENRMLSLDIMKLPFDEENPTVFDYVLTCLERLSEKLYLNSYEDKTKRYLEKSVYHYLQVNAFEQMSKSEQKRNENMETMER